MFRMLWMLSSSATGDATASRQDEQLSSEISHQEGLQVGTDQVGTDQVSWSPPRNEEIFRFILDLPGKRNLTRKQSKVNKLCLIMKLTKLKFHLIFYSSSPHYTLRQLWDKVRKSLSIYNYRYIYASTFLMNKLPSQTSLSTSSMCRSS